MNPTELKEALSKLTKAEAETLAAALRGAVKSPVSASLVEATQAKVANWAKKAPEWVDVQYAGTNKAGTTAYIAFNRWGKRFRKPHTLTAKGVLIGGKSKLVGESTC